MEWVSGLALFKAHGLGLRLEFDLELGFGFGCLWVRLIVRLRLEFMG